MVGAKDVIDAVDELHEKQGERRDRCTVIELKISSPMKIEEIKKVVTERFGNTSRVYFNDQLVKSFFDNIDWKEVR